MGTIELPKRLTLDELPLSRSAPAPGGQALRGVEIAIGEKVRDVIESIRKSTTTHVSLGKRPGFHIDGRDTLTFQLIPRERCFLYRRDHAAGSGDDDGEICLAGVLNLQQAATKPNQATRSDTLDLNDPALQNLQRSLAEHEQRKQASTTVFVEDSSQLPPAKSGRQAAKAAKANAKNNRGLLMPHRQGIFNQQASSRSSPGSPSLGGMTLGAPPRSGQEDSKQEALKVPLLHLLAVRPVSESFITKALNCSSGDIKGALEKYGRPNRDNRDKFDLSDRGYKDLDVWKFPYRNQEDRDAAIENATGAFDRQRITASDGVWQTLLPKEKRGKGITLSRLKLHTEAPARARTPKIQVDSASEPKPSNTTKPRPQQPDERPGHLTPNASANASAPGVRPDPAAAQKKAKVSEKDAQAKRLLSKNPKKLPTTAPPSKPASASPSMAGKKEAAKKAAQAPSTKIKSAEFIEDSDSDDLPEFDEPQPKAAAKKKPENAAKPETVAKPAKQAKPEKPERLERPEKLEKPAVAAKKGNAPAKAEPADKLAVAPKPAASAKKAAASSTAAAPRKPAAPEAAPKSAPMARQVSHTRKDSSPIKPSPLGSSPPTNASDLDNDPVFRSSKSSSSSNSPLMNQRRNAQHGFHRAPPAAANGVRPAAAAASPDRTLKRKAGALESSARADGRGSAEANGDERGAKRRQSSSQTSATSSGSGRAASDVPRAISKEDLASSVKFKQMQVQYARSLTELRALRDPPLERVEKLKRMHAKLTEHKAQLWRLAAAT